MVSSLSELIPPSGKMTTIFPSLSLETTSWKEDRAKFYQNFSLSLLEFKGCVGFDWFEYMDNDPATTPGLSNKGMLDCNGEEYTELTSTMQEVNTQKYNLIRFFDERNHK